MPIDMSGRSLCTQRTLTDDFRSLGLQPGSIVILHSSLSSLGFVVDGARTVIAALIDVLGPRGTLVVPAFSGDNSDPSEWSNPPVPEEWWPTIRDTIPTFDTILTRTRSVGVIPETLRTWPGALRSSHPQTSFAALGAKAVDITKGHAYDCALGEQSPLARLEELDAKALLIGVGWDNCTAFHLSEYRCNAQVVENVFAVMTDNGREWKTVKDCQADASDFAELGGDFEEAMYEGLSKGYVGDAVCRLFSVSEAVKFGETWMRANRGS